VKLGRLRFVESKVGGERLERMEEGKGGGRGGQEEKGF